jgi:hypothetical protein
LKRIRGEISLYGLDWSGAGLGPVEGTCEHGNEPSGSIKCWEILEWLNSWQLAQKGKLVGSDTSQAVLHRADGCVRHVTDRGCCMCRTRPPAHTCCGNRITETGLIVPKFRNLRSKPTAVFSSGVSLFVSSWRQRRRRV